MPVTGDSVLDVPSVSLDLRHVVSWHPISDTHLLVKLDALSEQEDGADDWVVEEFAVRVNTAEFEAAYTAYIDGGAAPSANFSSSLNSGYIAVFSVI